MIRNGSRFMTTIIKNHYIRAPIQIGMGFSTNSLNIIFNKSGLTFFIRLSLIFFERAVTEQC